MNCDNREQISLGKGVEGRMDFKETKELLKVIEIFSLDQEDSFTGKLINHLL